MLVKLVQSLNRCLCLLRKSHCLLTLWHCYTLLLHFPRVNMHNFTMLKSWHVTTNFRLHFFSFLFFINLCPIYITNSRNSKLCHVFCFSFYFHFEIGKKPSICFFLFFFFPQNICMCNVYLFIDMYKFDVMNAKQTKKKKWNDLYVKFTDRWNSIKHGRLKCQNDMSGFFFFFFVFFFL